MASLQLPLLLHRAPSFPSAPSPLVGGLNANAASTANTANTASLAPAPAARCPLPHLRFSLHPACGVKLQPQSPPRWSARARLDW